MPRSKEGSRFHMFMVNYIAEHLRKSGYKVSKFVRLPNNGIIDVYAERNGEIIIAECILRPTRRLIEEKIRKYKKFGKLIIVIPESYFNIDIKEENVEIWRIPVTINKKAILVEIDDELEMKFRIVVLKVKGKKRGALSEAVEEAIRLWLEKYGSQK